MDGIEINVADNHGDAALDLASENSHIEIVKL